MTLNELMEKVNKIRKGTFTRIVYTTEPTLSAAGRKAGVTVIKKTEKVVRLGVQYNNIEAVKEAEAARTEPKRETAAWCHWIVKDILAKHNTKEAYYLSFAYAKDGHNTKTQYFLNDKPITKAELQDSGYVIPSYFTSNGDIPVVQKVNIDNIVELGGSKQS